MTATKQYIERIKSSYPKGTRIELISMEDPFAPIHPGTKGTVVHVDDMGTIHMKWDNGRSLGILCGVDSFNVISKDGE